MYERVIPTGSQKTFQEPKKKQVKCFLARLLSLFFLQSRGAYYICEIVKAVLFNIILVEFRSDARCVRTVHFCVKDTPACKHS